MRPEPLSGTVLEARCLSQCPGIRHGFFTREGGVSDGDYQSLNVGYGSRDRHENVAENRRRIARHLGACRHVDRQVEPLDDILTVYQVHSARPVIVERPFPDGQRPEADALVTRTPGLAIGALTADCTPVLFADPEARVIAAAHAGWRGAVSGILGATIEAMESLGARRANIRAAIGPTISQANYEVGPEFKQQFLDQAPGNAEFFTVPVGQHRDHFDLPGYCRKRLHDAGVPLVEDLARCTYADDSLFYSYRRKTHSGHDDYGRQVGAIMLSNPLHPQD